MTLFIQIPKLGKSFLKRIIWIKKKGEEAGVFDEETQMFLILFKRKYYKRSYFIWLFETNEWPPEKLFNINRKTYDDRFVNLILKSDKENFLDNYKILVAELYLDFYIPIEGLNALMDMFGILSRKRKKLYWILGKR